MIRRIFAPVLAAILSLSSLAQGQDSFARYKRGKLSAVIKAHTVRYGEGEEGVDLGSDPVKARVTYTGESRPTPEKKRKFIAYWMGSGGMPEEDVEKFGVEFLFIEDSVEFWIPVQDVLIPHFLKEMRKGEQVDVFALWIGTTFPEHGKRQGQHVLIVNEFEKPPRADPPKANVKRKGHD